MSEAYFGNPSEEWTFAVTGTVTWSMNGNIILKDRTGSCNLFNIDSDALKCGEIIAATGRVHIAKSLIPWVDYIEPIKLGSEPLPQPLKTALKDCLDPDLALECVSVEATVVDILEDDFDSRYNWLILKDGASTIPTVVRRTPETQSLMGTRVEVTGPMYHYLFGLRRFISPFINAECDGAVRILTPAPKDPFDVPRLKISGYASQSDIERLGPRTVIGRIVAVWPPSDCLLLTEDRHCVRLSLAKNEPTPPCGSMVRAVGYPSSDVVTLWLTRARTRPEAIPEIPDDQPRFLTEKDLFPNVNLKEELPANRLITLTGTVKSVKSSSDEVRKAVIVCGGTAITVDFSARPDDFDGIESGCEIQITGRYILVYERWHPNNVFPNVLDTLVVLTERPTVLRRPSWWSTGKLLVVIALLVVALLALQLRGLFQKRFARIKLNERTQLAVEIHDSISQALSGLACHVSAARNTLETDTPTACAKLDTANQMLLSCRTELRNCLFDLRNDTLGEKNIQTAIRRTLQPFEDNAAILIRFIGPRTRLEDPTAHAILAIIRELVSNAIRHGHAWSIRIAGIIGRNTLRFSVTDDGTGFDFKKRLNSDDGHFGLDGIRERLLRLNGSITFSRPRAGGTKASVTLNLPRKRT